MLEDISSRDMMKKIIQLHQQGRAHCGLNTVTIFVDDKYDVKLGENQYREASQKNKKEDCVVLKSIIKAILGDNDVIPRGCESLTTLARQLFQ